MCTKHEWAANRNIVMFMVQAFVFVCVAASFFVQQALHPRSHVEKTEETNMEISMVVERCELLGSWQYCQFAIHGLPDCNWQTGSWQFTTPDLQLTNRQFAIRNVSVCNSRTAGLQLANWQLAILPVCNSRTARLQLANWQLAIHNP